MRILYSNGTIIKKTIAQLQSWDAIRQSPTDQTTPVALMVTNSGNIDLSVQLGSQSVSIEAYAGSMDLTTGGGNDFIRTGDSNDTIYGGDGDNVYRSGFGIDAIYGGAGKDRIFVNWQRNSSENDTIYGGAGDDEFTLTYKQLLRATFDAGDGLDRVNFLAEDNAVHKFAVRPTLSIEEISGQLSGTARNDNLTFGNFIAVGLLVDGGAGNDEISLTYGSGFLNGGAGDDTLYSGGSGINLHGGSGHDVLYGSAGNDQFTLTLLDLEEDQIFGGGGADTVILTGGQASHFVLADVLPWAASVSIDIGKFTGTIGNDLIDLGGLSVSGTFYPYNTIDTGDGDDYVVGSSKFDSITGGNGGDTLSGMGGNDQYFGVDETDIIIELANGGIDFVNFIGSTYTLPANVENLIFGLPGLYKAYGNRSDNNIHGTGGAVGKVVVGYAGDDNLGSSLRSYGGSGDDRLQGANPGSRLYGGTGNDSLIGGHGNDRLIGGAGSDEVRGYSGVDTLYGDGSDTLDGGADDDIYFARQGDVISEEDYQTFDRDVVYGDFQLWAIGDGIEDFVSTSNSGSHIIGNDQTNYIAGSASNDTLEGGEDDQLIGGAGDDTYFVTRPLIASSEKYVTTLEELGGGLDRVVTTGYSYSLQSNIEELDFTSLGNSSNIRGNELDNLILAHAGKDTIDGGLGSDTMDGGDDDDTYIIDNATDLVLDTGTTTYDEAQVYSSSWKLTKGVETAIVEGALDTTLIGNALDNLLIGFNGADSLQGGSGNDILIGWAGHDLLTGNSGSDIFAFDIAPLDLHSDIVTDFAHGFDAIFLASTNSRPFNILPTGQLAAADFKVLGGGPLDSSDRVLYDAATGTLFFDPDGNGAAAAVKFAVLSNLATVDASDIWVY